MDWETQEKMRIYEELLGLYLGTTVQTNFLVLGRDYSEQSRKLERAIINRLQVLEPDNPFVKTVNEKYRNLASYGSNKHLIHQEHWGKV